MDGIALPAAVRAFGKQSGWQMGTLLFATLETPRSETCEVHSMLNHITIQLKISAPFVQMAIPDERQQSHHKATPDNNLYA